MSEETTELAQAYQQIVSAWKKLSSVQHAALLDQFALDFAYASGKIENDQVTYHDTREVFEQGRVLSYTGDVRTLFEIQNLKRSWEWALNLVNDGFQLNEQTLLEAHQCLTQGTYDEVRWAAGERPGTYKIGEYVVGAQAIGEAAAEVPGAIAELLEELASSPNDDSQILVIAAYFHAKLADIHPFADGNGRVARLLMNMLLLAAKHPPIIIHEQNRLAYYGALDAFHDEAELKPFTDYLKAECVKTWQQLLLSSS